MSDGERLTSNATAAFLVLSALCIAVYMRGLFGGFLFDDYPNIVTNRALQVGSSLQQWLNAAMSSDAGLLKRPVSMLSFAANYYLFEMSPVAFKAGNLIIHLFNGWLVFALSRRLLPNLDRSGKSQPEAPKLALFVTALWLLNPLNVSSVLYIVQRMTILSATFVLSGLLLYVKGRQQQLRGDQRGLPFAVVGLLACGALATLTKENGALIFPLALITEWLCFGFSAPSGRKRSPVIGLFLLTVALPAMLCAIFILTHWHWLPNSYSGRDFTLSERLLTEPRILWHYVLWIFVPNPQWMGMYHDDIAISTSLTSPSTTLIAISAWLALTALVLFERNRARELSFAVAWFLVAHSMESTALPLELTFEHRNYLPMVGILLGAVAMLRNFLPQRLNRVAPVATLLVIMTFAGLTAARASTWGEPLALAMSFAENHPGSARSQYDAGRAVVFRAQSNNRINEGRLAARPYFLRAMALDKTNVHSAVGLVLTYANGDVIPQAVLDSLEFRLRNIPRFFPESFVAMMNALSDGWITIPAADVAELVTAALDNPAAASPARAEILNAYGRYQFKVLHNAQSAVSLTLAAAEQAPGNVRFRLNLANLALAIEQPKIAREHLLDAKSLDSNGSYTREAEEIQSNILALERSKHANGDVNTRD